MVITAGVCSRGGRERGRGKGREGEREKGRNGVKGEKEVNERGAE